jgi:hypothetical protein
VLAVVVAVSAHSVLGQSITADTSVARVGDYVERYYARAQSIIVDENVAIQPLGPDLRYDGFARRLMYELRVEWNPDADNDDSPAKVTRQLIAVNGRPPKPNQEPGVSTSERHRNRWPFYSLSVAKFISRPPVWVASARGMP